VAIIQAQARSMSSSRQSSPTSLQQTSAGCIVAENIPGVLQTVSVTRCASKKMQEKEVINAELRLGCSPGTN